MTSSRFSLSLVGVIGVFVAVLSAAALWLAMSDPVSTATANVSAKATPCQRNPAARSRIRSEPEA